MNWNWTTIIAVISLFLSIINTSKNIYDWLLKRREEKEKQEEKKKAKIKVSLVDGFDSKLRKRKHLYIKNEGKATANNIKIEIIDNGESLSIPTFMDVPRMLAPGSDSSVPLMIALGTPPLPWRVRVSWDDDYKIGNSYETEIS